MGTRDLVYQGPGRSHGSPIEMRFRLWRLLRLQIREEMMPFDHCGKHDRLIYPGSTCPFCDAEKEQQAVAAMEEEAESRKGGRKKKASDGSD